ncbi:hypothetical protein PYW08_003875 [Mythimna loreyi]|uniref:Uncharacterized protein n=1 Tax=Mythimna loreyi TaxID=667449 RepID=A0ACC2QW35_9NEOP|nr:hypothetical protein PYW08_003875 [Mythimna loreyi]
MIIFVTFLCFLASSYARPNFIDINPQNVITVPPNCPPGFEWVNGACREIWSVTAAPANLITVPTNCPPGQSFINGQCRDVWNKAPVGETNFRQFQPESSDLSPQNMVTVPTNCRPGQQWINGACRDIWRSGTNTKNVITVPTNCPPGQQFINGHCRDVWNRFQYLNIGYNGGQPENYGQNDANRNVISVPNQCPAGYRPDALGNCRPIFSN